MSLTYSEEHPTYKKKKREFEERLRAMSKPTPPFAVDEPLDMNGSDDPVTSALELQIEMTQLESDNLIIEETRLRASIAEYRRRIAATPAVQSQVVELESQRNYLRDRYRQLQRDADVAVGTVDLEEEQMLGNQMEVLEYASVPMFPYAPDPLRVSAVGVMLGCLLFVGPLLARNLLNPVILSEKGFQTYAEFPVLVSIPNLHDPKKANRRRFFKNLGLAGVSIAALVITKFI